MMYNNIIMIYNENVITILLYCYNDIVIIIL